MNGKKHLFVNQNPKKKFKTWVEFFKYSFSQTSKFVNLYVLYCYVHLRTLTCTYVHSRVHSRADSHTLTYTHVSYKKINI
jgi:hypothetical protein